MTMAKPKHNFKYHPPKVAETLYVRQAKTITLIHFQSKGGSTSAKVWLIVIEDYRVGKDITNDKDVVKNIEQVIQRRQYDA